MHLKQQIERYGRFKPAKIGLSQKEKDQQMACGTVGSKPNNRFQVVYQHHTTRLDDPEKDSQRVIVWKMRL